MKGMKLVVSRVDVPAEARPVTSQLHLRSSILWSHNNQFHVFKTVSDYQTHSFEFVLKLCSNSKMPIFSVEVQYSKQILGLLLNMYAMQ
jgi:hypothetical protein